ncbi:MAG: AarF/UbiB family protein [Verrucomicrobiota bacterium]|nr:AarF/UbiB family protein [Verrucomicrobiota bacterium]
MIKHGFYEFVKDSRLLSYANLKNKLKTYVFKDEKEEGDIWKRIRLVFEKLGPAFVKLGQFISSRPDLVPKELCSELENLLDNVPQFPREDVDRILQREFRKPIDQIFKEFEYNPHSSASIAQVHKAVLKNGQKVAVKIQRPNITDIIHSDLETMSYIVGLMEKFVEGMDIVEPKRIVSEFSDEIKKELNFSRELGHIQHFCEVFKDDESIYVPKVYNDYCTKTVLTMEFVDGVSLNKKKDFSEDEREAIVDRLSHLVFQQIFEHGYFHADPHPGNILILEDNVICFVDFGLVGIFSSTEKEEAVRIVGGLVNKNSNIVTRSIIKLCETDDPVSFTELESEIHKMIQYYAYMPLRNIDLADFFKDLIDIIISHKLRLPLDAHLLIKALTELEGTIRKVKPDFNTMEKISPLVKKMMTKNMHPWRLLQEFYGSMANYSRLMRELPDEVREIVRQFRDKKIKIQLEHQGLDPMLKIHSQISNRIAFSIITASMLIASSLIIHAKIGPYIYNISAIGLAVFTISMFMGLFLLFTILRHGRM